MLLGWIETVGTNVIGPVTVGVLWDRVPDVGAKDERKSPLKAE